MKSKKAIAGLLTVSILSLSSSVAFAADLKELREATIEDIGEVLPISIQLEEEIKVNYGTFTGVVKDITDHSGIEGAKFVNIEGIEGSSANVILLEGTYIINEEGFDIGSTITVFYDANAPMIMIYPPQYKAEVIYVNNEGESVKVGLFDQDLVSEDNYLKIYPSEETSIINKDGEAFDGELGNKNLIVIYGISTKSIPAQTTPKMIVVLPEEEGNYVSETEEDISITIIGDVAAKDIVVNNGTIKAPAAYLNEEGLVMVPLRAIAEALGFDVTWNQQLQRVTIGEDIYLTIGEDNYANEKTLGAPPVIMEGRTFVPLSFFREVANMNNAYVFESQIVIDNGDKME